MQVQEQSETRQQSDSSRRTGSELSSSEKAHTSPILNPRDFEEAPLRGRTESPLQSPPPQIGSPREIDASSLYPPAEVADPPKYLEFSQEFDSYKKTSRKLQRSSPSCSVRAADDPVQIQVSPWPMSAPKPQAVTWVGLGFLAVLGVIGSCVLICLEIGSGMVKWKVAPLRTEVRPVSCEPQAINDGLMVHIDCPIRKLHTFYPPSDFRANLDSFDGLFFEMKVEMFQDTILPGSFKSSIKGTWSDHLLPTQRGWSWDNNKNPDFFPHVEGSGRKFGSSLYGGGFKLERPHVIDFHTKQQLPLTEDQTYVPSTERPPTKVTSRNTRVYENALYTGDPLKPKVGDIRISFFGSSATHLSAVGLQSATVSSWTKERDLLGFQDPFSKRNATRTIVMEGDYTAKSLLDAFENENDYCGRYLTTARSILLAILTLFFFGTQRLHHQGSSTQPTWFVTVLGALLNAAGTLTIMMGLCALMYSALVSTMWVLCGSVLLGLGCFCQRSLSKTSSYQPLLAHEDVDAAPSPTYITHTAKVGGGTATPSASYAAI